MAAKQDTALKWIEIDDFTPGLISNSGYQLLSAGGYGAVPGKALGQAQSAQGCIALPNGGLAPGPGLASTFPWGASSPLAPNNALATGAGAINLMNGLFLSGPKFYYGANPYPLTQGDELIVGQYQVAAAGVGSGAGRQWIDSLQAGPSSAAWNNIVNNNPGGTQRVPVSTMTGGITRANSSPSLVGIACWALGYWVASGAAGAPTPGVWGTVLFPNPSSPTSFTPNNLEVNVGGPREVFCHQNRIGWLRWAPTNWSNGSVFEGGNEEFWYTDPPNGLAIISSAEVFVQEDPSGYGAWGSQSASELFLVKNRLGGVVIQGDLNAPTVTALPGVTPTYGLMSRGASTPIGFVYASNNHGLWAWNGGNTSQKISTQLEDNFFINADLPAVERGPTVDIQRWGDWIITSNGYLYDTITGGWWNLPNGALDKPHQWYQPSSDGKTLYAAYATPSATNAIECFTRTPSHSFVWESYPIRLPNDTKNKELIVREFVVRAMGHGTITINAVLANGSDATTAPTSITFNSPNQPIMLRLTTGAVANDVTISVTSIGWSASTPAPIIYSIAVGYEEASAMVSAT